ncbi:hypothetical protein DBQ04_00770 [Lactobacillus acidophilus]|uniref:Uncharacterized protein n=1 Tax=Lactobacillus acidophilus (strain ATCC 700396 / NCK56 / N2 / NCFM) TaxID=272621 RepID=Q5FJZ5_LACAC|nr:hypothetical protein LBA1138 [Lactobacillus acidophilus NCFM]AZN76565.1 hypothetical protein CXB72_05195 [Lactobacillus acidophilus]CDF67936.1 Putative uncharacterized protein [Lactobacillus acidophilus DSM 20079 = JCM 1132 = NBRC 13951 = CIP 76.13]CDF69610.1 Putative uncharacterized protein [Lactobacillus acidophilus CIRM-BIA 442]CDF71405.1 Putative uncharacterized protein [Lactobacillus acidophilus CIRM-BIA 445]CDF73234.1 Putative uncharacterized protein [Lactobacillus acidophilus DSM 912
MAQAKFNEPMTNEEKNLLNRHAEWLDEFMK